ncbi:MAG: immunoglobulin domain-containing protein [Pyrinomonadaceae bacterium]|nr:immunoglobulin domain-containing protein [Phycisphaerales bacterium]
MGQHPNGTMTSGGRTPEENWAVRRWIVNATDIVRITGEVWDRAPAAGNGVITRITLSGSPLYEHVINNGETARFAYSVEACIGPGNTIDFIVDPRNNDDQADDTGFTAVITSVLASGPQSQRICSSSDATFSVTVTGNGPYFFQWRRNGVNIPGAQSATLTLTDVDASDVGSYYCLIANNCGVISSGSAELTLCRADFNCDVFVNSQDFFDFLAAFFSAADSANFNGDEFINSQDFFDFLAAFFAGCA